MDLSGRRGRRELPEFPHPHELISPVPETVPLTLPAMGESVTEGTVVNWVKKAGDPVTEGETLVEVTTDKVDVEVPSPVSGTLTEITAPEGETVPVGATLGIQIGRASCRERV